MRVSIRTSFILAAIIKQLPINKSIATKIDFVNKDESFKTKKGFKVSLMVAHDLLGHHDENKTCLSAAILGWTLKGGSFKACTHCAKSKAKCKAITQAGNDNSKAK